MAKKSISTSSIQRPPPKKAVTNKVRRSPAFNHQQRILEVYRNAQELSRTMLAGRLGTQFGGKRDLYETFGYPLYPTYQDYRNLYDRHGLAARVIDKYAGSTWGKPPVLIDGSGRSDDIGVQKTPFLEDWNALVDRLGVWQIFKQADIMAQIGRYAIIFLGAPGEDFSKPAGNDGLFYLAAYDESQTTIASYIQDTKNEKFGMPETYSVAFNSIDQGVVFPGGSTVHYTRVIHVSENRLGSRIFGKPRLQSVLNRLYDLEKVTGGGAEAAWLAVYAGMLLIPKEGYEVPEENSPQIKTLDDQMQKLIHQIQRYAVISGVDVHDLGVKEVRIRDIYDTLKTDYSGGIGVPQRILFGSERGELASSQDMQEWNATSKDRQINFAEPEILRPFVNWCVSHKIIRPPASANKKFGVEWQPVYTMSEIEQANYGLILAQGASAVTNGVPDEAIEVNEWRGKVGLPPKAINTLDDLVSKKEPPQDEIMQPSAIPELIDAGGGNGHNNNALIRHNTLLKMDELSTELSSISARLDGLKHNLDSQIEENRDWTRAILFSQDKKEPSNISVNVKNYPGKKPRVEISNQIEVKPADPNITVKPTPIQNIVNVQPTPFQNIINVLPTPIQNLINNIVKPASVKVEPKIEIKNEIKTPKVKSEIQTIQKDSEGNLIGSETKINYEE